MTDTRLTDAELALLRVQRAHGIPFPADIFAWRAEHAAELAAIEAGREPEVCR